MKENPRIMETSETINGPSGEQLRINEIKSAAARYEQLKANEKVRLMLFIKQDIAAERERIVMELQSLDTALGETQQRAPRAKPAKIKVPRAMQPRSSGEGMTYNEAILAALQSGEVMEKQTLFHEANQLAGGRLKLPTFNATLPVLKAKRKIKSPERGQFQIA